MWKIFSAIYLQTHEKIHLGKKPFVCKYCEKCFRKSSALIIHERIHTGEKPFLCKICPKSFGSSSTLLNHKKVHIKEKKINFNANNVKNILEIKLD